MADVTHLLDSASAGDPNAAAEFLPLVYEELRLLAARKMAHERSGQTLQATALVHEAWIKLSGPTEQRWENRRHFFAAAAEAMRRILIDRARKRAVRHANGLSTPEELQESQIELGAPPEELLAVNEALDGLEAVDEQAAKLVKLRYFVGMTLPEAAECLSLPLRSTERLWTYSRAWLRDALQKAR